MGKASRTVMLAGIGLAILAGLATAAIITTDQKRRAPATGTKTDTENTEQAVGGDRDIHGCIGSAGYQWCEVKQKCLRIWEEPCGNDESFDLMRDMEKTLDINFTGIGQVQFEWKTSQSQTTPVTGTGFSIPELTDVEYQDVENYFKSNGYKTDLYNAAAGTTVSQTGFAKNPLVCLMNTKTETENQTEVQIKCGVINKNGY